MKSDGHSSSERPFFKKTRLQAPRGRVAGVLALKEIGDGLRETIARKGQGAGDVGGRGQAVEN